LFFLLLLLISVSKIAAEGICGIALRSKFHLHTALPDLHTSLPANFCVSFRVLFHTWTPTFAKLSFDDFEKVKIAAIHPDFV